MPRQTWNAHAMVTCRTLWKKNVLETLPSGAMLLRHKKLRIRSESAMITPNNTSTESVEQWFQSPKIYRSNK
eukprot:2598250-Amphidinium_carterae.3